MSLNVSLPSELEKRVRDHVASGLYSSASEVIREALRLFETYHAVHDAKLASLKSDISDGMQDVIEGRIDEIDMKTIKGRGRFALQSKAGQ